MVNDSSVNTSMVKCANSLLAHPSKAKVLLVFSRLLLTVYYMNLFLLDQTLQCVVPENVHLLASFNLLE